MKKMVRNLFAAVVAMSLIGSLASCADSDAEDPFATTTTNPNIGPGTAGAGNGGGANNGSVAEKGNLPAGYKAKAISFDVSTASTNAEKTVLLVKYDRTAAGAEELISINEADVTIKKNGTVIKTIDKIEFELDPYGSSFSGLPAGTEITDKKDMKEYKVKLPIGGKVVAGDKIEVSFTKCKVNTIGSASSSVKPTAIQVALVDIDPSVDYYKELSATEYLEIFEEVTASQGGNAGQEQGNTGASNGGQAPADIGLLDAAGDLAWDTPIVVSASKFASVDGNKKLTVTYTSNNDNDYHKFKMMAGDGNANELFAGIATGFTIDLTSTDADNLHGCEFSTTPSATAATFSYQPSVGEWTKIKQNGFKLIGHGAKITKVVLEDSNVANPADASQNTGNGGGSNTSAQSENLLTGDVDLYKFESGSATVDKAKFANVTVGAKLVFTYEDGTQNEWGHSFKAAYNLPDGWAAGEFIKDTTTGNGYVLDVSNPPKTFSYTLTDTDVTKLKEYGLAIMGDGVKFTKLVIEQ